MAACWICIVLLGEDVAEQALSTPDYFAAGTIGNLSPCSVAHSMAMS